MAETMTKGERDSLQRLIRQREDAQKSAAKLRSKELLADFENQIAAEYAFDDDAVWAEAIKLAEAEVGEPIIPEQQPIALYENVAGNIVIRRPPVDLIEDSDVLITVTPHNAKNLATELVALADEIEGGR